MTLEEDFNSNNRTKDRFITSFDTFLQKDIPEVDWLVNDLIMKSGLCYIYGPPGTSKTNFALLCAIEGGLGQPILGYYPVKRTFKTIYIDEENREPGMYKKIKQLKNGLGIESCPNCYVTSIADFSFNNIDKINWLESIIVEYKPDLIIMDSVSKVFNEDERDERDVKKIYQRLKPLIINYKTAFVLIHHTRKLNYTQKVRSVEDMSGSREFSASADTLIQIEPGYKKNTFNLSEKKHRYSEEKGGISFSISGEEDKIILKFESTVKENISNDMEKKIVLINQWLLRESITSFKTGDINEELGCNAGNHNVKKALREMQERGIIKRTKKGCYDVRGFESEPLASTGVKQ